jgi:hypothetical protein
MDKFITIRVKKKKGDIEEEFTEAMTFTFGDQGENNVGMEKVGNMVDKGGGVNLGDLLEAKKKFEEEGFLCELYCLNDLLGNEKIDEKKTVEDAYVLVIRKGMNYFLNKFCKKSSDLYEEMNRFEWDSKYWCYRRKRVLNKHARHNVCFGEKNEEPDYDNGKGRIVGYENVECLNILREGLIETFNDKGSNLVCEGNRYYDLKKCGIGWHGDSERRKVFAFRLGASMNINFNWFYRFKPLGGTLKISLNNTDMYVMSEKTVGTDWKSSSEYTIRHCAGLKGCKYLKI